jgi:transcription antitermination factor NusG
MSVIGYEAHLPAMFPLLDQSAWYAIHIRARHEKKVTEELKGKGIETFLPLQWQINQWSDRKKRVEVPLFPCYAFVNVPLTPEVRAAVQRSYGVLGLVGTMAEPTAIPSSEIDAVKQLLASGLPVSPHPYCRIGQRVRVRGGPLEGVEGILTEVAGSQRVVLTVETVHRSVSVSIDGYQIEAA